MKKLNSFIIAAMAIAMTASCTAKLEQDNKADVDTNSPLTPELVSMTFSAFNGDEVDTKTTYKGRNVYWEESDVVSVFSVAETVTKNVFTVSSLSEDKSEASFTGMSDASAQVYYAVYPHNEANKYDNGLFTVNIPTEQVGKTGGFAQNTNVTVAVAKKDAAGKSNFEFKNISTPIYFKFETAEDAANTKSVTIKARKSEDGNPEEEFLGISGSVTFTLDDNGTPIVSEGSKDYVILNAPASGFVHGVDYVIPVAPVGNFTGLRFIFTDQNGREFVCDNNIDQKFDRNVMFNNNYVPRPYLPAEITLEVDFSKGWPFTTDCVAVEEQKAAGDVYKYNYTYGPDNMMSYPLTLAITFGNLSTDDRYEYEGGTLNFYSNSSSANNSTALIMLPRVEGRYLSKVKAIHATTSYYKRFIIQEGFMSVGLSYTPGHNTTAKEYEFTFPVVTTNGVMYSDRTKTYSLRMRDCSMKVQKLVLTYTRNKPE